MPEGGLIHLDGIEGSNILVPVHYPTAREVFDYAWASALLDQVLAEVAKECHAKGMNTYWEVFRARVLAPILDNAQAPPLADVCKQFGVDNEPKASQMIFSVKELFRKVARRHIRQLVRCDDEVDDEIQYLMKILSGPSGRL